MRAYGNIGLYRKTTDSPVAWTKIANVKSFDGPNTQLAFQETTDFDSVGGFREYEATLKDPGQLQMTLNFDPADLTHEGLEDLHDGGLSDTYQLRFGTGSTQRKSQFDAYVESLGTAAEVDGLIEMKVTLRITGNIDRDAA